MVEKHIVFIYKSNVKQIGIPADVASIPLCRIDDHDETVVAYAGVLWEGQMTKLPNKAAAENAIRAKAVYIHMSDSIEADQIDRWLEEQGYKKVLPKEEGKGG